MPGEQMKAAAWRNAESEGEWWRISQTFPTDPCASSLSRATPLQNGIPFAALDALSHKLIGVQERASSKMSNFIMSDNCGTVQPGVPTSEAGVLSAWS
jgi:hypothetical protein